LKLAQAELGYLPPAAVAEVADLVGVSHAAAHELVTFYSMLHTERVGRQVVEVCVQLPCAVRGAEGLLRQLAEGLAISPGETTPDGLVTLLRTHECYGACHRAPMCRVNDEYVENLGDKKAVSNLLKRLKPGEAALTTDSRQPAAVDGDAAGADGTQQEPTSQPPAVDVPTAGGQRSAVGGPKPEGPP
jgi:NADH-quinone oxidoreductase subunit E